MTTRKTHSATGEAFAEMSIEQLRKVMRRTYRFAADTPADARSAQEELRSRRQGQR